MKMKICDTTLRDGEQAAGVVFTYEEKKKTMEIMAKSGIDQAEAGIPAMGEEELNDLQRLAALDFPIVLSTWNRAVKEDLDKAYQTGIKRAHVSIPTSPVQMKAKLGMNPEQVEERIRKAVAYGQEKGLLISVGLEDASRADQDFLIYLMKKLVGDGVQRFRYADTVSVLNPVTTSQRMERIIQSLPKDVELEIHCHNDFGLATANTLAALSSGVQWASTTVIGLGERAGNAALEEVVMAWRHLYQGEDGIDATYLQPLAAFVSKASGRKLSEAKPIVGSMVFAHESGIHVDGLLKNPQTYQSFDPGEIGRKHQFVPGKHSGFHAIVYFLQQEGIEVDFNKRDELMKRIRLRALRKKRALHIPEVKEIARQLCNG